MKRLLSLILLFIPVIALAQETAMKGRITNGSTPLESAHILNLSKEIQTISDDNGQFEIEASVADTLVVTFLGYRDLSFRVTQEQLEKDLTELVMSDSGIPLEEVTVTQNRSLDPVALGLISKRPKKLRTNERKLKEAGDFKAVQLLGIVGGGVPLIPLLNKITGRTKRLKKRVAMENENLLQEYLSYHYSDYINQQFGLEEEWIDRFLYYAVIHHQWDDLYPDGNKEQFHFRLIQVYQDFTIALEEAVKAQQAPSTTTTGG